MRKIYFKVVDGYDQNDFIPIELEELEKAIVAKIFNKFVMFKNGSIQGSRISKIVPDYHKSMGWNYGHKMNSDDWNLVHSEGVHRLCMDEHQRVVDSVSQRVTSLKENNNTKKLQ